MYRQINTQKQQIIINTAISSSTTTTKNINNKITYTNTKYIANLPQDVLLLLLEKQFNTKPDNIEPAEWINKIIENKNIYLQFERQENQADAYNINIVCSKEKNNSNCLSLRSSRKYNNYTFTVSKKLFKLLKNNNGFNYSLEYVICFKSGVIGLDNCVVCVRLV